MLQTLDTTKTAIELNSTTTATDGESNDEVLSDASTRTAEEIKFIEKVRLVMCINQTSFSESQYRWYQALYQIGVFISRSSVHFFRLPLYILILLTVLQWMNTTFFFFDAIYAASYVNTFYQIHVQIHPLVREFSLSFATLADGIGIVLAGIFAIPTHNFVCKTLLH
ncbi:Battenin [Aphelenchoides besseyi]|nr:Battenin [Aphelenchoides besseyi]